MFATCVAVAAVCFFSGYFLHDRLHAAEKQAALKIRTESQELANGARMAVVKFELMVREYEAAAHQIPKFLRDKTAEARKALDALKGK